MAIVDAASPVDSLQAAADRAMMAGDPRSAAEHFQRAVVMAPDRVDLWIGLAACRRSQGERTGALEAIDRALTLDPRCFPALLMKGSLLESLGQGPAAAKVYGAAVALAPPEATLAQTTSKALAHAREVHEAYGSDLVASLKLELGLGDAPPRSAEDKRLAIFIEALAGRRKIFHQEPMGFHYPGLPAIEFFEREEFAWIAELEARTDDIRRELLAVWAPDSPELEPYINYADSLPLDQWGPLNRSLDWSAYHLYLGGARVEPHCQACPATMTAVDLIPQPDIPGRSPSAMFSILRPGTRIPPHTGVANTRAVVHLPLMVPEGCGFRVGGDTRQVREGEAWVFDDTIEHEAWNESAQPRAILICDTWNPRLPLAEREAVAAVMAALDRFNGEIPATPASAGRQEPKP